MKIGYVQMAPVLGQPQDNREKAAGLIEQSEPADLLVLPELCNSGYRFESKEQAIELAETVGESKFIGALATLCKDRKSHVVAGLNERDGDQLYNTSVLIGPEGVVGKYRKMHLFMDEKDVFAPGDLGLPVFDCGDFKVGMVICFDWIFPEVWRILALKGADIICHPSNLVIPGLCQKAVPVHAVCNRVFVVTANRYGTERDLTFTGLSTIADPKANVLRQAPAEGDEVGVVEIDLELARNKQATARNHVFDDRRPREYGLLTGE